MLPVLAIRDQILLTVERGNRFVLTAPTGSGKTTQVPQMLAASPHVRGTVIVLEPRRLAARMTARRVAFEMKTEIGKLVGYQTRFESRVSPETRIRFVTEGVFLRLVQEDPTLTGVGAVILDEFHERSIDADLALGLEVVLPDGRVWDGLRGLRKDNTGYDLKHLFIGAEGTLGLITAAVLKLYSRPRSVATAWASVPTPEAAVTLLTRLREKIGGRVTAFELVGRPALDLVLRNIPGSRDPLPLPSPWQVLIELSDTMVSDISAALEDVLAEAIVARVAADAAVARNEKQAQAFWALRENISEAQKIEGVSIKHDISLPVSRIPEFVDRCDAALGAAFAGVRIVCFGHLGDGNLHYNQSKPHAQDNAAFIGQTEAVNRIVHDLVTEFGGSISAEHGLGQLKRREILRYKSDVEMDLMRKVKQALDPGGLMNPGKVL